MRKKIMKYNLRMKDRNQNKRWEDLNGSKKKWAKCVIKEKETWKLRERKMSLRKKERKW